MFTVASPRMPSHRLVRGAVALAVWGGLAGCASMGPEECRVADWYQVGQADGARGEEATARLSAYVQDCGKVGVQPVLALYRQGWQQGQQTFCTPASGWREGVAGRWYKADACDTLPAQAAAFRQALQAGYEVYQTRERIGQNHHSILRLERRLRDKHTSDEERSRTRMQLHFIDMEQSLLRRQLNEQERWAP